MVTCGLDFRLMRERRHILTICGVWRGEGEDVVSCGYVWVGLQVDACGFARLPGEAEHEVRLSLHQVAGADVDDVDADGLGGVEREVEILDGEESVGGAHLG